MSTLTGVLEVGDVVDVTYYSPIFHGTIEQHRAGKVYKVCRGVVLTDVGTRDLCSMTCEERHYLDPSYVCPIGEVVTFVFKDTCHPSLGGRSYGSTDWADVVFADGGGLW